jgi:hypothetical protein
MPTHKGLITALVEGASDQALYFTCVCLRDGHIDAMEEAWIEMTAKIGAMSHMMYTRTWMDVNRTLVSLIESESYHIADALGMTTRLFLLYHRLEKARDKTPMQQMRRNVLEHFPEGATLTQRGFALFQKVLPPPESPAHAFCQRLLAGFSKLYDARAWKEMHSGLEYISRKKLQIPIPSTWPAPSEEEALKGEPLWFLWGMIHCMMGSYSEVATLWQLFSWKWRKGHKATRLGLLWGCACVLHSEVEFVWTKQEQAMLARVEELSVELWKHVREEGCMEGQDDVPEDSVVTNMMATFHPRRDARSVEPEPIPEPIQVKVIEVRKGGRRGGDADIKGTRSKVKKVNQLHEASDSDPRYRWLDFGTKGSGVP